MGKEIRASIRCQNIAPFEDLSGDFNVSSLKLGIYANNGSGKTYLSRMFRILEPTNSSMVLDDKGGSPTDCLLRFGSTIGNFAFKIDNKNTALEDITLTLERNKIPSIPKTNYIYHTFNQDYIDENIQEFGYNKNGEIQGYILGKANIDLTEEEATLNKIKNDGIQLRAQTENTIQSFLNKNITPIRDIKRIKEYGELLTMETLLKSSLITTETNKSLGELLSEYNKVKSIPDNIEDIPTMATPNIDLELLKRCIQDLKHEYSLSSFAKEFKEKVNRKRVFYEDGVKYYSNNKSICPFCEQTIISGSVAEKLIDDYTNFLSDNESETIRLFNNYINDINSILNSINTLEKGYNKIALIFNKYKTEYLPYFDSSKFISPDFDNIKNLAQTVINTIKEKIKAINISIELDVNYADIDSFTQCCIVCNDIILRFNKQLSNANLESRRIRKEICKAAYNELRNSHKKDIEDIEKLRQDYQKLENKIKSKKEQIQINKKDRVYDTIAKVLNYFFSDKYTLNKESFRLVFKEQELEAVQTQKVLSEGEKNIIAFAYYLGDAYIKIMNEDDYQKLFFIIDDPISSMDYAHVYTLCGVLRNLRNLYDNKIEHMKFIILSHNNDFMQILSANKIIGKALLLENGQMNDTEINYTVPYIANLLDIYRIARCNGSPSHTTANSIRHIIETIIKFQNLKQTTDAIQSYIDENFNNDICIYTLINDLSHGGWKTSQRTITDRDYKLVCEALISHIESTFPSQIKFCQESPHHP